MATTERRGWPADGAGPQYLDIEQAPTAIIVDLVRRGIASTRPELVVASGLGRKIVTQRVDESITAGLLVQGELAPSGGGRPSRTLHFNAQAGVVAAIQVGVSEMTVGLLDLSGTLLEHHHEGWDLACGPDRTFERALGILRRLLRRRGSVRPWAIAVGVPGPVNSRTGALVRPPIMSGWDGFSPRAWLRSYFDAPVWVDNDANLMALGELASGTEDAGGDLLFVKIGSGIGSGIVIDGRLVRGHRGGAGDIGHMRVTDDPDALCKCGRTGCLDAVSSGWSILRQATARADDSPALSQALRQNGALRLTDIGRASRENDPVTLELCGRALDSAAAVIADLTNFLNPGTVVLGGGILEVGDWAVTRFRDGIMQRAGELVRDDLEVRATSLPHTCGLLGAGSLALGNILSPPALSHWVADGSPSAKGALLHDLADGQPA